MSFANIFYILGVMLFALSGVLIIPILIAGAQGETVYLAAFGSTFVLTALFGGGLMLGLRGMPRRSGMRETVFLIFLAWLIVPYFASLPFLIGGTYSTLADAYFEAVSALTTTGMTLLINLDEQPASVLIWRATLQWLGGFGVILMAIGVFSALSFSGLPVRKPPLKFRRGHYLLDRLKPVALFLAPTYVLLTLICFILLWVSGLTPFDALCMAFSTISTGGFMTREGTFSEFSAPGAELIVFVFMIVGGLNFVLHNDGVRGKFSDYKKEPEFRVLMTLILGLGLVFFILSLENQNTSRHLFSSIFNAASLLTTTGYTIGEGANPLSGVPLPLILSVVLIGGSAMSTAGGLKLIRFILLFRHIRVELNRLSHPHSVVRVQYGEQGVDSQVFANIWVYFVCLTALVSLVGLVVGAEGYDFTTALSVSVASLSNAGPILESTGLNIADIGALSSPAKWTIAIAMIIGRVEVLLILPLFNRFYWQG